MSQMTCKCSTVLHIPDPSFEVYNGRYQSMLIFNHALMSGKCSKCGFEFMGFIESFDIQILSFRVGVCPVPPMPEQKLIETVPEGFDIRKLLS